MQAFAAVKKYKLSFHAWQLSFQSHKSKKMRIIHKIMRIKQFSACFLGLSTKVHRVAGGHVEPVETFALPCPNP